MVWSDKIFKKWLRHREIEGDDVRIYRPIDYKFPLSRGREGLEFRKNGEFVSYEIAPGCGIEEFQGKWEAIGESKIKVTFQDKSKKSRLLNIISCEEDIMKLRME
jgi:hypothetical protein